MDQDRGYVDVLRTLAGAAAAILAALILFLTFGFQADQIEVMGSTQYTEEEIADRILVGMFSHNTLFSPMLLSGTGSGTRWQAGDPDRKTRSWRRSGLRAEPWTPWCM